MSNNPKPKCYLGNRSKPYSDSSEMNFYPGLICHESFLPNYSEVMAGLMRRSSLTSNPALIERESQRKPQLVDLCEEDKKRIAQLIEEIARSQEEKASLKNELVELGKDNSQLLDQIQKMKILLENHQQTSSNEISHLKATCKNLEKDNIELQKKYDELQHKIKESNYKKVEKLKAISLERQDLMAKTHKQKDKIRKLIKLIQKMDEEIKTFKSKSNVLCDEAVQFPDENIKQNKESTNEDGEICSKALHGSAPLDIKDENLRVKESTSTHLNEESLLNDLFFCTNGNQIELQDVKTVLNCISYPKSLVTLEREQNNYEEPFRNLF